MFSQTVSFRTVLCRAASHHTAPRTHYTNTNMSIHQTSTKTYTRLVSNSAPTLFGANVVIQALFYCVSVLFGKTLGSNAIIIEPN